MFYYTFIFLSLFIYVLAWLDLVTLPEFENKFLSMKLYELKKQTETLKGISIKSEMIKKRI